MRGGGRWGSGTGEERGGKNRGREEGVEG